MSHRNDEERLDRIIGRAVDLGKVEFDRKKWLDKLATQEPRADGSQAHRTESQPPKKIWRTIMESRITRYSVAATVLVAASVVLFGPFGGRHSVALADVAQKLNETRTVMHKEKRLAWRPGEDKPFYVGEVRKYISTDIGFMEEMYDGNGRLDHRYYLLKEGQIVLVFPKSKRYARLPAQGRLYDELLKMSTPAGLVNYFRAMPYTRLGRSQFDGFEAEGFEVGSVDVSLILDYIKYLFPIQNISATLWVEAKTSLPAGIEMRIDADPGFLNGFRKVHAEFAAYDFEWDVPLPEGVLDPDIPADYTQIDLGVPAVSVASAAEDWMPTCAAPRLWPVDEGGNGHAYQGVPVEEVISWTFADRAATLAGGYLATITSQQENEFAFGLIGTDPACWRTLTADLYMGPWLGGYQPAGAPEPAGGWLWVTGEPFEYTAWLSVEPSGPNEDRLHYMGRTGSPDAAWNDQPDSHAWGPMAYLVEYDPVTFEAEEAAVAPDDGVETAFAGYSGAGYIRLGGQSDTVRWITNPGMAEPKGILLRYSNGTSQDVSIEVAVNGVIVEPNLVCPPTGAWDTWGSAATHAPFISGENVVEVRNSAEDAVLAIDKITVFGDNTNLAMDRLIAYSAQSPAYPASQAVDADLRTFWRPENPSQWLEVDLGDVYRVYRTQLAGSQWQACQFKVEVKAQTEDAYVQVVDRTGNTTRGTAKEPIIDTFEPTAARYVRLTVTGTDWGNPEIAEFRISAATGQTPAIAIGAAGYSTIQEAIGAARDGDVIVLQPGSYPATGAAGIGMRGRRIMLTSTDPNDSAIVAATVIAGTDAGPALSIVSGEDANCVVAGLTISGARTAFYCDRSSPTVRNCRLVGNSGPGIELRDGTEPTIRNCLVAGNSGPGVLMGPAQGRTTAFHNYPRIVNCTIVENLGCGLQGGSPTVLNSIVYSNGADAAGVQILPISSSVTYSDIQGGWPGEGNLDVDPCFAQSGSWYGPDNTTWIGGDYHLQSQAGRWDADALQWVIDAATSPCIDAGDPAMGAGREPAPNGERINLGAYGGTTEAGMSP
ncbi:MAG: discoidin domain-containing protein [Phycisphaerales bacterium]